MIRYKKVVDYYVCDGCDRPEEKCEGGFRHYNYALSTDDTNFFSNKAIHLCIKCQIEVYKHLSKILEIKDDEYA